MSDVALVHVIERSSLKANAPTSAELHNAFVTAAATVGPEVALVGPTPRIVRIAVVGAVITHVAMPVWYSTEAYLQFFIAVLRLNLDNITRDFSDPAVMPFYSTVSGPIDWWQSGAASVTRTREMPDEGFRGLSLTSDENPIGPNAEGWSSYLKFGVVAMGTLAATSLSLAYLAGKAGPAISASRRR